MTLTTIERGRLAEFAKVMLPGGSGMSGADQLKLSEAPVERVLCIEPALNAPLCRILAIPGRVENLHDIESIASIDPKGFKALATVLANAYFMCDTVRMEFGYPGQEARDSSIGLTDPDRVLLDKVYDADVTWRRTVSTT